MTSEKISELITENMKTIFAFAMSKVRDQIKAEELASDIIYEILRSYGNIKNDDSFFSYMWSVSNNVFKRYLRNQKKKQLENLEFSDEYTGMSEITPESQFIDKEQMHILRRELSLLSSQYREATVKYYMDRLSCAEIAENMGISIDMVKYYLFKTRKILKEGIGMTREFGEKSYNPGTFRPDKWNDSSSQHFRLLFDRKLPGNILLSAYYSDVSIQELSIELGVSAAYLEDEIDILIKNDALKKLPNGKYRTNIIIFTSACETEIKQKTLPLCQDYADKLNKQLRDILPEVKKLDFNGNTYDDNRLLWMLTTIVQQQSLDTIHDYECKKFGEHPLLYDGTHGFYYGFDHEYDFVNRLYNGVYNHIDAPEMDAELFIFNYRIIEKCQFFRPADMHKACYALSDAAVNKPVDVSNETMLSVISDGYVDNDNGILKPLFPVFSKEAYEQISALTKDIVKELSDLQLSLCEISADIMEQHAPEFMKNKCRRLAYIRGNSGAYIVNSSVEKNLLYVPDSNEKLCMYAILK